MKNINPWLSKTLVILSALSLAFAVSAAPVFAASDAYPSKPLRVIVPSTPGSSSDTVGRVIAAQLNERLGQPVIVENRPGAAQVLGSEMVAKAAPDGYTLLSIAAAFSINPAFYKLPFDPVNSFSQIAKLGTSPNLLVVHPSLPVKSVKELIALAKQKPGQLVWAAGGIGSNQHMAAELFKMKTGTDFKIVQFKGGGAASIDVLGGHSQVTIMSTAIMIPHIKAGKVRVLGTSGASRSGSLPDVPTIAEAGVPGFETTGWWGFLGPAGMPAPILDRLSKEMKTILASDELKKFLTAEGAEMDYLGPTEFRSFLVREIDQWKQVVKAANIQVEK